MKHVRFFAMLALCCLSIVALGSPALAGSTGGLSGVLTDNATGAPLAHAKITVASPSQVATLYTDGSGSFTFLSLAPDTYTVSAEIVGYDVISTSGVTVTADQVQRLTLRSAKTLRTIGSVRSRSGEELVRPGTVTDTYTINSATQERITGLTGGGSLNQAYSALAATPGVFVPSGQSGWSQTAGVTIRGGTHSQIGYEFDGVPVNVGVNGFSGTNLSTLGQQEIQVYSGSAPLNSEAQGLSGYVNQVVKTGTYPGFAIGELGIGGPFYHKASFEIGGATKDRNFSYYLGTLGANQAYDVVDNYNGASYTPTYGLSYGTQTCPGGPTSLNYASCYLATTSGGLGVGPGGFVKAPVNFLSPAYQQDRENIVNLHFGIPHKNGTKDDVQLLYQTGGITSQSYSSANDLGVAPYDYPSGYEYHGALATLLPANYKSFVAPYAFPEATVGEQIPANLRDTQQNNQSIFKAQYQHNMGNAYLRVYGYSLYSTFQYDAPNGGNLSPSSSTFGNPPDYKLWTHTSGYSGEFADQLSPKDLLLVQASYTHAPSVRDNNTAWATPASAAFAVAVDSTNPNSGMCYAVAGPGAATPASCQTNAHQASFVTYGSALGLVGSTAPALLTGARCGAGPCSYYVVDNGNSGANNTVVANNVAASLSDQWKPTRQLTIDAGIRFHDYQVQGADTGGGARDFWFNAYNQDFCVNASPGSTPVSKKSLNLDVTKPCSNVLGYVATQVSNGAANYNFVEYEPRIGVTYAAGPNDVFRASYGKYSEPAPTAYQQYNTHQQNLAAYLATRFYKFGYTGSGHDIPPQESFNVDGSWEHGFKGSDVSFKATPFYRTTRNELTEFFIDPVNQLTSGLAVGSLKTSGVEFQLRKGSFERNGLAALLSYTYTNASIKYYTLPGGGSIISPINNDIRTYNAYTSFCATHATDARCGNTTAGKGVTAARCYTAAGAPDATCAGGSIANPYWNAPVQSTLDPNGSYVPTDPVVATTGLGVNSYTVPHIASLVLNYRHNAFAFTPSIQFQAGQRYGLPEANAGIDPAGGCKALAGATTANDPRYTYGAAGGAPYDALTCTAALTAIPNVFTNKFDAIGAFTSPSQLLGSFTASYDLTKNLTLSVTGANVFNQCFGGTKAEWTGIGSPHVCSYESGEVSRGTVPTGNAYNPGAKFDPFGQNPYYAYLGPYTMGVVNPSAPFELFVNARLKL